MNSDAALLERYAASQDPEAFAELMQRYAGLVYGTCMRVLGNRTHSEDVTQECFFELARHSKRVRGSLPGWLHCVAVRRSRDLIRREVRRQRREAEVGAMRDVNAPTEVSTWHELAPYVDEGVANLPEPLRDVILRRFMQAQTQTEIGDALGVNQSTVSRHIDKGVKLLRKELKRKGVIVPAALLATLLAANTTQAAPAAFVAALGKVALAGVGAGGTTHAAGAAVSAAKSLLMGGLMIKAKAWVAVGLGVVLAGALIGGVALREKRSASIDSNAQRPPVAADAPQDPMDPPEEVVAIPSPPTDASEELVLGSFTIPMPDDALRKRPVPQFGVQGNAGTARNNASLQPNADTIKLDVALRKEGAYSVWGNWKGKASTGWTWRYKLPFRGPPRPGSKTLSLLPGECDILAQWPTIDTWPQAPQPGDPLKPFLVHFVWDLEDGAWQNCFYNFRVDEPRDTPISMKGLPAGPCRVVVVANPGPHGTHFARHHEIELEAGILNRVDIKPPEFGSGYVHGIITGLRPGVSGSSRAAVLLRRPDAPPMIYGCIYYLANPDVFAWSNDIAADGSYTLDGVQPGRYTLTVAVFKGHLVDGPVQAQASQQIEVALGEVLRIDLQLKAEAGPPAEN